MIYQKEIPILNCRISKNVELGILNDLRRNIEIIEALLDEYPKRDIRGKVCHADIQTNTIVVNSESKGSFLVQYDVEYHFGCSDLNTLDEDEFMRMSFEIDFQNEIIRISGEVIQVRDFDEI